MNYSQFWIENEVGTRFGLNPFDDVKFADVQGLGISNRNTFAEIDDGGFRSLSRERDSFQPIVGTLRYTPNAYEHFRSLCDFLQQSDRLYFLYSPLGGETYYRRVRLAYLNKAGRESGWMDATASFEPLTPWYLPTELSIVIGNAQTSIESRFPFPLDGTVHLAASAAENYSADVTPSGHIPASVRIIYSGVAKDPVFTLTGVSGKEYGRCAVTGEFSSTDSIILDTAYEDSKISLIRGGVETDLINQVDISNEPFFRIPMNEPCVIRITAQDTLLGTATASIKYYLRAV